MPVSVLTTESKCSGIFFIFAESSGQAQYPHISRKLIIRVTAVATFSPLSVSRDSILSGQIYFLLFSFEKLNQEKVLTLVLNLD